ncbi:MAG: hypothetical protein NZ578_06910 [Candidatus Binatia bacterium]|nr:hypothetical protein [Candidatus Binatia bacterium]
MPPKDPRVETHSQSPEVVVSLKRVERFLRLLTWQLFFLLAILLYLAMGPQPGRYQFTVAGEDVLVFDTAYSRAFAVKLQKQNVPLQRESIPSTPSAVEGNKE